MSSVNNLYYNISRGHPHLHGMAWSNLEELNKKYQGLQGTFKKLKERDQLSPTDIKPLRQFINATVTCTTSLLKLKKKLSQEIYDNYEDAEEEEKYECTDDCRGDPEKCDACSWKFAKLVKDRVEELSEWRSEEGGQC